ncbi:MAG: flagellar hook-basal body protein [Tissierellaceae bacterium]|nr:flagellar hook-basal body protein [Tissierellaceae bacterium]
MNSILNIGKTGLHSVQRKMDSISDDIANVNTFGYKKKDISFQELLTNEIHENDVLLSDNANDKNINMGAKSRIASVNFEQGVIVESSGEFHMAIEGQGFFGVLDGEGNMTLTRNGSFNMNPDGSITNDDGYYLNMNYHIAPEDWGNDKVNITADGEIIQNTEDGTINLGKIILYNPGVLDSLIPLGEGRYLPNQNVDLYNSIDYVEGFGDIRQYALETSNVDLAKSLVDMITSQRSYSLNLKALQTTDDIMSMINNIK